MFSSEQSFSSLVILDYREIKDSVVHTCWMVFAPLRLESYPTDRRTHIQTLGKQYLATNVWRGMNISYQRRNLMGLQRLVHYLLIAICYQKKF